MSVSIQLPGLDCGLCGVATCTEFQERLTSTPDLIKRCVHLDTDAVDRVLDDRIEREKRLADWHRKREHEREFLREVPDAFDFRMAGEETLDGRRVYVIDATPRSDYRPRSTDGKLLSKMKGRLWIDAETYDWAKAEAETFWSAERSRLLRATMEPLISPVALS